MKTKNTKKLDIIIPAYKAQESIERTLASIIIQSVIDEVKVTIVNDADTNDYSKIINRYKDLVDIQEIKLLKNGGPGVARQFGIDSTDCPFFTCIDADDTFAGAFSLAVLLNQLETNPNLCMVAGNFAEEHENLQFLEHPQDLVWMFGKIYRRDFINRYDIRFNYTRANEDNGFNTMIRLCSSDQEQIGFLPDIVYYWHSKEDSITRINNCEYSYNQSFPGYTDNMIYAVIEAKKRKPFNGMINLWGTQVMFHLFVYYLQTCERDPRFSKQNYNSCVRYYNEVFKKIRPELSDQIFKEIYSQVIMQSDMINIAPNITIYQFLDEMEKAEYKDYGSVPKPTVNLVKEGQDIPDEIIANNGEMDIINEFDESAPVDKKQSAKKKA